ncbi:MAG: ankyrin repeat domain-containing protein [Spirochaetales bacterium]|nr:ankyrin repeat domain-containing protein [Spirochaetales bacterium]
MKRLVFIIVLLLLCITGYADHYSNLNTQKIEELLVGGWECHRFFKDGEYNQVIFTGMWKLSGRTLYIQTSNFYRDVIVYIWQIEYISAEKIIFKEGGKQHTLRKTESDLVLAVVKNDVAQVRSLIAQGRNVNIKAVCTATIPHSLLSCLIEDKSETANVIMQMLLDAGADPDLTIGIQLDPMKIEDTHTTPLMRAVRYNNLAAARILINAGADIHKKNQEGKTALNIAVEQGNAEMIQLLRAAK